MRNASLRSRSQSITAAPVRPSRCHLNQTFYERFYIDDLEVVDGEKTPLFTQIHQAATDYRQTAQTTDKQESPRESGVFPFYLDRPAHLVRSFFGQGFE